MLKYSRLLKLNEGLSTPLDMPVCTKDTPKGEQHYKMPPDGLIETFVESLSSPSAPQHCARFYLGCIDVFTESVPLFDELRHASPDIFTSLLRFLTHKRSDRDLVVLVQSLAICRCPRDHNWIHSRAEQSSLRDLVDSSCSFLVKALQPFVRPNVAWPSFDYIFKEGKKAVKRGERVPWPRTNEDALPNPPHIVLETTWKFYHAYRTPMILYFVQLLIGAGGTTFTSLLYTLPSWPEQVVFHNNRLLQKATWDLGDEVEFQALTTIMVYVVDRFFQYDVMLVQIWRTQAHSMLLLLTKALQRKQEPHRISSLIRIGHILLLYTHESNPTVLCNLSFYSPLIVKPFRDQVFGETDYLALAWDKTRRLAQSDHCQAPGCTETHATQNRKLQICSGFFFFFFF